MQCVVARRDKEEGIASSLTEGVIQLVPNVVRLDISVTCISDKVFPENSVAMASEVAR